MINKEPDYQLSQYLLRSSVVVVVVVWLVVIVVIRPRCLSNFYVNVRFSFIMLRSFFSGDDFLSIRCVIAFFIA